MSEDKEETTSLLVLTLSECVWDVLISAGDMTFIH